MGWSDGRLRPPHDEPEPRRDRHYMYIMFPSRSYMVLWPIANMQKPLGTTGPCPGKGLFKNRFAFPVVILTPRVSRQVM
eukprot:scaffold206_cov45-Phaeocystis_antarctica.AAC.1